jgi:hypothetical protein
MCKINIAAYDRRIMPHRQQAIAASSFRSCRLPLDYAYVLRQIGSVGGNEAQFYA